MTRKQLVDQICIPYGFAHDGAGYESDSFQGDFDRFIVFDRQVHLNDGKQTKKFWLKSLTKAKAIKALGLTTRDKQDMSYCYE